MVCKSAAIDSPLVVGSEAKQMKQEEMVTVVKSEECIMDYSPPEM